MTARVGRGEGKEAASQEGQIEESRCEKDDMYLMPAWQQSQFLYSQECRLHPGDQDAIIRHASSWKAERASTRVSRATLTRNSPSTRLQLTFNSARALRCKSGQVRARVRVSEMQIYFFLAAKAEISMSTRDLEPFSAEFINEDTATTAPSLLVS
jgi:hypothetical protein